MMLLYPLEVAKTKSMCEFLTSDKPYYQRGLKTISRIFKEEKIQGNYRGFYFALPK